MKNFAVKTVRVIFLVVISFTVNAQTQVSGYILTNTTWTLANSPYRVTGNILVNNGVTLTIQPGVTVKFDTTKTLQIDGELIAIGNDSSRITFTATDSTPVRGSWGRIQFHNTSVDATFDTAGNYVSGSIFKYCDILYGGGIGTASNTGVVHCDTSAPYFAHVRIAQSKSSGIYFNSSSNNGLDSSSIRQCSGYALYYYKPISADLIIRYDTIEATHGINANIYVGSAGSFFFSNAEFYNNTFISNTYTNPINHEGIIGLYVSRCIISNNVFTSNTVTSSFGGVIYLDGVSYWMISGNQFASNYFSGSSSSNVGVIGINSFSSAGTIRDNIFIANSAIVGYGDPVGVINARGEIFHNYFEGNTNVLYAIGTVRCNRFFQNHSSSGYSVIRVAGVFENNVLLNNTAGSGGSIAGLIGTTDFKRNLVSNNSAPNGNIILHTATSTSTIHSNDIINNTALNCVKIQGGTAISLFQNNFSNPGVQYEINDALLFGTPSVQADSNYWGTVNAAHIDSVIRDFFDDGTLSVVIYPPVLTAPVVVDTVCQSTVVCALTVSGTVVSPSCYGGSNGSINITVSNGTSPFVYSWNNGASSEDRNNLSSGTYSVTVIDANLCSATKSFTITQPSSSVSVASGVVINANCNAGGSINVSGGGGTSPYTYNWGSGITTQNRTGLNPGNYSVTVRDNYSCSVTRSFTVGQDAGPVISGAVTNANCHNGCDGAINLTVTGIPPFTYDWGNGFGTTEDTSGLCTGTYNVTVADSNNCGIAATFTIASPVALSATTSITADVSCFGYSDGAALAVASGGTAPYNFLWSDGQTTDTATALSAGAYDVTVTDSLGCTAPASITIPDGYHVFVGVIGGSATASLNQSSTYIVSANFNYSYAWSVLNGIIVNGQGSNSIEVTWTSAGAGSIQLIAAEQGCTDTVSKSVTVIDTTHNCSAQFYLYPDTVPHSYFAVNTASGIAQLSYSWNWGDGSNVDTVPYPTHTYNAPGFYTICLSITDSAGCSDTYCNPYFLLKTEGELGAIIQVNVVPPSFTGIQDATLQNIELYPNPTSGTITLKAANVTTDASLRLYDFIGKQIIQQDAAPDELHQGVIINMQEMNAGVFFLSIKTDAGTRVMKVVKY